MKHDPCELAKLVTDLEGYPLPAGSPLMWPVPLRQWDQAGKAMLRALAKDLGLVKPNIRYLAGGNACPGSHVLHADRLYVCFDVNLTWLMPYGFVRSCQGTKDYVGGLNHSIPPTYAELVAICQHLLKHPFSIPDPIPTKVNNAQHV